MYWENMDSKIFSDYGSCTECEKRIIRDSKSEEFYCESCGLSYGFSLDGQPGKVSPIEIGIQSIGNNHHGCQESVRRKFGPEDLMSRIYSTREASPKNKETMRRIKNFQCREFSRGGLKNKKMRHNLFVRTVDYFEISKDVAETATDFYLFATQNKMIRGRVIEYFSVACFHSACNYYNMPKFIGTTIDFMMGGVRKNNVSGRKVSKKEIGIVKKYSKILRTKLIDKMDLEFNDFSIEDYLGEYEIILNENGCFDDVFSQARIFLDEIDPTYTIGKNPIGVAAALLRAYSEISGKKIKESELCIDITEPTLRARLRELRPIIRKNT